VRLRIRYTKLGKIRWIGHRDVARVWDRALRRVQLPVALTAGFTPRPKISFGLALSTGHESLGEYLDVELAPAGDLPALDTLASRLSGILPAGLEATAVGEVVPGAPSLQQDVVACRWELTVVGPTPGELSDALGAAFAASSIMAHRTRKGATSLDDLRPALLAAGVLGATGDDGEGRAALWAELATHPRSLRPDEFLAAVLPGAQERRVLRTHQWIERDGVRREPLPVGAPEAPHALERAS